MLITTTPGIEGRPVTEYLGIVTAQGVLGVNAFRDMSALWHLPMDGRYIGLGAHRRSLMAAVTSEGAPGAHHQLAERLRAAVLGPRGGGTTRRRASDAFRLGLAVVVVVVSIPVMRANSAVELSIVHAVHPPPAAISWLVTTVFWVGSAGVSVLLVIVGLLVPRLTAVRWTAVAAVLTWGVCISLGAVLGPAAGRPPLSDLSGINTGYPVTQIAIAIAVAATALSYLSRPVHRLVWFGVAVAVLTAVSGGYALPVNAVSSMALGWGVAAALHLAVGSPLGLPSAAEVTEWIADLNVAVADIIRAPSQEWGVEQFTGRDPTGKAIEVSVYGRDASDARVLASGSSPPTCPRCGDGRPWPGCADANTYEQAPSRATPLSPHQRDAGSGDAGASSWTAP